MIRRSFIARLLAALGGACVPWKRATRDESGRCVGDGLSDDTAWIQAQLDTKGFVHFQPGNYHVSSDYNFASGSIQINHNWLDQ